MGYTDVVIITNNRIKAQLGLTRDNNKTGWLERLGGKIETTCLSVCHNAVTFQ